MTKQSTNTPHQLLRALIADDAYVAGFQTVGQYRAALLQQAAAPEALPEHDPSKPAEQQGLFHKFDVRRTDGSDQKGGKHHGCRYYVLDLTHDQHALAAMRAYAAACATTHPQLAAAILAELGPAGTSEAPSEQIGMRYVGV